MEKLNIVELLKDCPTGMELNCTIFEDVHFDYIDDISDIINCYIQDSKHKIGISFNKYGCYSNISKSKCVIFPKGKTTWVGFQRPFKDGDVVATLKGNQIFIFKENIKNVDNSFSGVCYFGVALDNGEMFKKGRWHFTRLATEEEKQKLFKAIKDEGYKWNTETKTLEKLPKFKVGDKIKHRLTGDVYKVLLVISNGCGGGVYDVAVTNEIGKSIDIKEQDSYELVPNKFDITTLKPFESRVLVRDTDSKKWNPAFWGFYDIDNAMNYPYECCGNAFAQCIPYEGNEHLLGTTDDCDEYYKTWK